MKIENIEPKDIETKSFEIITQMLAGKPLDPKTESIVKRCIHTSADFDYADNLYFSPNAVDVLVDALRSGHDIITDTQMAKAGIDKLKLGNFGGQVHCFIADDAVKDEAIKRGITRAIVSMEKASKHPKPYILAIGNAPTALLACYDLINKGQMNPSGIIGVPVGFVNVVYSKEQIMKLSIPCIVAKGRKGGSNIAAAICNALLKLASNGGANESNSSN